MSPKRDRPRRQEKRTPNPDTSPKPAQIVKIATTGAPEKVAVEVPLSPEEITDLKRTFRFLHEHRKVLKLKLNAQEDLLLNGAREPEHRGVCQHLLSKVEHSRVVATAERLDPKERVRFVEGILQFTAELPYLLLYLEALKESGHAGAHLALGQALRRIDFSRVSEAQMRRVLDLLVESFSALERPRVVLGLLESRSFREALDSVLTRVPPELGELFGPLSVAREVILRGIGSGPSDMLASGVSMLLEGGIALLEPYKPAARQRLLELALGHIASGQVPAEVRRKKEVRDSLRDLIDSVSKSSAEHNTWRLRLCRAWMSAGEDEFAEKALVKLTQHAPDLVQATFALKALRAPRIDRIALLQNQGQLPTKTACPLKSGYCLETHRELWVRIGRHDQDPADFEAQVAWHTYLQLPSVVPIFKQGKDAEKRPYVAYPKVGKPLKANAALSPLQAFEVLTLVLGLAKAGCVLPDLDLARFEVQEPLGRVWLLELWGAATLPAEQALDRTAELAKDALPKWLGEAPDGAFQAACTNSKRWVDLQDVLIHRVSQDPNAFRLSREHPTRHPLQP